MIEQALYKHLQQQAALYEHLTTYDDHLAIFNQEAPDDSDSLWGSGSKYGRIVFAVDLQGDPERIMGGTLALDIMCEDGQKSPDEIEPIVRSLIHGYFFSSGTFTVAAQWKNSSYFTQPTDYVAGCTVSFDLLGFPVLTTIAPDVVDRINEWCAEFPNLHVINHAPLPETAWKPTGEESAIYWRLLTDNPAGWIPDTYQTIWRTATIKGHIFSQDNATAAVVARRLTTGLYACKRLFRNGEAPIMVNRRNTVDVGADALRTGQMTVEATFGIIVARDYGETIQHVNY